VRETSPEVKENNNQRHYGGIGRLAYLFGMVGALILGGIVNILAQSKALGGLLVLIIDFVLTVSRLQNMGRSGWWSLLILVPFANLYIGLVCITFPKKYQETKELDTAGKIIMGISIALIVLMLLLLAYRFV